MKRFDCPDIGMAGLAGWHVNNRPTSPALADPAGHLNASAFVSDPRCSRLWVEATQKHEAIPVGEQCITVHPNGSGTKGHTISIMPITGSHGTD